MSRGRSFFDKIGWGKTKIRHQINTVYAITVLVPLTLVGIILIFSANRILNDHYIELLESDNRRVRSLLSEITTTAYNITQDICFDNSLRKILSNEYSSSSDFVASVNSYTELDDLMYNSQEVERIDIYTDNPTMKNYKTFHYVTSEVYGTDWFQKATNQPHAFWASIPNAEAYTNKNSNLCIVRRITLPDSSYRAVAVILISDAYIRSRIDTSRIIDIISLDDLGVVYSTKVGLYGQQQLVDIDYTDPYYRYSGTVETDGGKFFSTISTTHLYMTNSTLYVCTMDNTGFTHIERIMNTWLFILLFAVIVPGFILMLFSKSFADRVNLLRKEMRKARLQDYNIISDFSGNDELSEVFDDLKFMVQDIKAKDAKMYEAELQKKELENRQQLMEYKMLASQINPHYLYNTLETIRMKALTSGNRDVADAIKILGKTLHYVMENTGTTYTTLGKELEHVENYLRIQKLRFGERINYVIHVQSGLNTEEYKMLPLLIQPLVENAVVHGLEEISGPGMIRIAITLSDDYLRITVEDSGAGIDEHQLESLCAALADSEANPQSGIALYNIHKRVRLSCGADYGLTMESKQGTGTRATLLLPARSTISV